MNALSRALLPDMIYFHVFHGYSANVTLRIMRLYRLTPSNRINLNKRADGEVSGGVAKPVSP